MHECCLYIIIIPCAGMHVMVGDCQNKVTFMFTILPCFLLKLFNLNVNTDDGMIILFPKRDHHIWCLHLPCFEINCKEYEIQKSTHLIDLDRPRVHLPTFYICDMQRYNDVFDMQRYNDVLI